LKKDRIRNRTTFTPGDSHNRYSYWHGTYFREVKRPVSWDQAFIPWKERLLLIPVIAKGLLSGKLGLEDIIKPNKYQSPGEFGAQGPVDTDGSMSPYKMAWEPNMDYIEAQVWGRINLDDVETFEYSGAPPTGKFLKELQKRGIKIRQAGEPSATSSGT
jgi:hypothetical protein